MPNYEEETKTLEVPAGTGVAGVLRTVEAILQLGRVQEVVLKTGKATYTRLRKPDEPERVVDLELETLMPSHVVRGSVLRELDLKSLNAAVAVGQLFLQASVDGMNPVAFVSGTTSELWAWYEATTKLTTSREEFYGVPFYADANIPDEVLVLCCAQSRRAAMIDVTHSYKITIPAKRRTPS